MTSVAWVDNPSEESRGALCLLGHSFAGSATIHTGVRINELVSNNTDGLEDEDGAYVGWIELYNENASAVTLQNWQLRHTPATTPATTVTWTFPAGAVIPPEGYLLAYASTAPTSCASPCLHTGFALDATHGGYLALYVPNAVNPTSDVTYPALESGTSYAYFEDSTEEKSAGSWSIAVLSAVMANVPIPSPPSVTKVWNLAASKLAGVNLMPDPNDNTKDAEVSADVLQGVADLCATALNERDTGKTIRGTKIVSPDFPCNVQIVIDRTYDVPTIPYVPPFEPTVLGGDYDTGKAFEMTSTSLLVVDKIWILLPPNYRQAYVAGLTCTSTKRSKAMMILAVKADNWNPIVFAHELGRFGGIVGSDNSAFCEQRIMGMGKGMPWLQVTVGEGQVPYFQGTAWPTRSVSPPICPETDATKDIIDTCMKTYD